VNHYERLKVTQDAPVEVIRAAYRALAQALPGDAHREAQILALNTAYETLMDPELRQGYDIALAVAIPDSAVDATASVADTGAAVDPNLDISLEALGIDPLVPAAGLAADLAHTPEEDLDDPWQSVYDTPVVTPPRHWTRQPLVWVGGALVMVAMVGAGVWMTQLYQTNQFTQSMAVRYDGAASGVTVSDVPPVTAAERAQSGDLSVEELANLSDEELLEVLPEIGRAGTARKARDLPSQMATPRTGRASTHPLDGAPLSLRPDAELIDPLAP
jgi:hypothetical protein